MYSLYTYQIILEAIKLGLLVSSNSVQSRTLAKLLEAVPSSLQKKDGQNRANNSSEMTAELVGDTSTESYASTERTLNLYNFNSIPFKDFELIKADTSDANHLSATEGVFGRYNLYNSFLNNGTATPKVTPKINVAEEERMICILESCYFEAGIWNEADEYFEKLYATYQSIEYPLKVLSDIVNKNLLNDHILEGVLHVLSNYDYEEISPFGITIAIACNETRSPVIQELLISCFEKWDSPDAITILEGLKIDEAWLIEYRDEVITQLKCTNMSA